MKKEKDYGGWGFSKSLLDDYMGEDEYIMRVNIAKMHSFRWRNEI